METFILDNLKTETQELSKKIELLLSKILDNNKVIDELKNKNLVLENKLKEIQISKSISIDNDFTKNKITKNLNQQKFEKYIKVIDKCIMYLENQNF